MKASEWLEHHTDNTVHFDQYDQELLTSMFFSHLLTSPSRNSGSLCAI